MPPESITQDLTPRRRPERSAPAGAMRQIDEKFDRIIVVTDEQVHDSVPAPAGKGTMINVASYKHGVGYGKWTHIDGWSESVVEFIRSLEQMSER